MRTTSMPRLRRHIAVVEVGIIVAIDLTTGIQARRPLIVTALIHIDTQAGTTKGRDLRVLAHIPARQKQPQWRQQLFLMTMN